MAERGLEASPDARRRWLLAEGLWQPKRRRDPHRSRRPRRACFGERVPRDASIHDWTEGRGEDMVRLHRIDDAASRLLARFYDADDVLNHRDLLLRWLQAHGRPLALYTDRHGIFEPQDKGHALPEAETPFGRALRELSIELIRARSPQAKGRVERSFGAAQDRLVKEMRRAGVKTIAQANALLDDGLLAKHNRMFSAPPREAREAHRELATAFNVAAILSLQEQRTAANDYTVRFENRIYQVDKPIYAGLRQGRVTIELRLDGTMAIRFGAKYLKYHEIAARSEALGGSAPPDPPKFTAVTADARGQRAGPALGTRPAPWRTADRRALGSHFCGALSSRRRQERYQEGAAASSRRPPLAKGLQAKVTVSRHRTFLLQPK